MRFLHKPTILCRKLNLNWKKLLCKSQTIGEDKSLVQSIGINAKTNAFIVGLMDRYNVEDEASPTFCLLSRSDFYT
jgi:hypothetical protein